MSKHRYIFLFFIAFLATIPASSQRREKETNKQTPKSAAEKDAKKKEAKMAEYQERKEHHVKIQDKETRKRMKKTQKKAERHSWGKEQPWYKRWFRKKKI